MRTSGSISRARATAGSIGRIGGVTTYSTGMGVRSDGVASGQGVSILDELAIASAIESDVAGDAVELPPPVPPHVAALIAAAEADDFLSIGGILAAHPEAVDCRGAAGSTALMEAVLRDELRCAELLLASGADPAAVDPIGWTSLHFAAHNKAVQCTAALLAAAPGTVGVVSEDGETALDLALARAGEHWSWNARAVACALLEATLPAVEAAEAIAGLPAAHVEAAAGGADSTAEELEATEELAALEEEARQLELELELEELSLEVELLEAAAEAEAAAPREPAGWTEECPLDMLEFYRLLAERTDDEDEPTLEPVLVRQWAVGRVTRCADDEALLAALTGAGPLAEVVIPAGSKRLTAGGLAAFVQRAAAGQVCGLAGSTRPGLVLTVERNDWCGRHCPPGFGSTLPH